MSHKYFQQMLCEHNEHPCGKNKDFAHNYCTTVDNPACGDSLTLYMKVENDIIMDIGFSGDVCDFCTASASVMCHEMVGKHIEFANETFDSIQHCLYLEQGELHGALAPMKAFGRFPSRVECALLPWQSLDQILMET